MCLMETIFIVDDNPMFIDLITIIFAHEGYHVRSACDPLQALDAIKASPPDLLLVDMAMPRMSGIELVAELQRQGLNEIPVLLMTAGAYRLEHLPDNILDVFTKPLDVAELVSMVRGVYCQENVLVPAQH